MEIIKMKNPKPNKQKIIRGIEIWLEESELSTELNCELTKPNNLGNF